MATQPVTARTKFVVPFIPHSTIVRRALLARLDAEVEPPLTVLAAAPGSGKTSLLAQWVRTIDRPVAWLSCTMDDADPSVFWRDVEVAIRQAWSSLTWDAPDAVDQYTPRERTIEAVNNLALSGARGAIVVDDFHLASPGPTAMTEFVDALPRGVRLVLGTRADPSFPLGRLRVQGRLLELRQADLQLTLDEITMVLADVGVELSEVDLKQLETVTEGWATGVHLAGLSLRATAGHTGLMQRLLDTDRSLVDFLMNEVIDLLPADLRDFLTSTAVLETFDAGLCDVATGRDDGAEMLQRVRAANLFLVELDRGGGWYRYHPLFGEFLRARLQATAADRVPLIHRAAAEAYNGRGDLMSSVRHSIAAGDATTALDRLTASMTSGTSMVDQASGDAVARSWLMEHGEAQLIEAPAAVVACVIALEATGSSDLGGRWLQRLESRKGELDTESRFLLLGAWAFHLLTQGDPAGALSSVRLAAAMVEAHDIDNGWVPALPMVIVQAQLWLGDADGALATMAEARGASHRVISEVRAPGYAALAEYARGELTEAAELTDEADSAADALGLPDTSFGRAEPTLTSALLAIERLQLDRADVHLERLMNIVDNGRRPVVELAGALAAAQLAQARGDHVLAALRLDRARRTLPAATPAVLAHVERLAVRLDLDRGDHRAATDRCRQLPPSPATDLEWARIHLAAGDDEAARELLRPEDHRTDRRSTLVFGLVAAQAHASVDLGAAHQLLHDALVLAAPVDFVRTIIAEGPRIWDLLESVPKDRHLSEYVARLLAAADGVTPALLGSSPGTLIDPLSERELTVLRYLGSRLDGTEIAAALYLSVNTVRSHVKAIYRKLGVHSRTDAIRAARAHGLI